MKTKKRQVNFPDEAALKRVRDKLSDPNYTGGNIALPAKASETDRAKYQICQLIARSIRESMAFFKRRLPPGLASMNRVSAIFFEARLRVLLWIGLLVTQRNYIQV